MTLDFRGQRPPQLVVAEGNNIFEVTEPHIRGRRPPKLVVTDVHNIFEVTEPHISGRKAATVHCARRAQDSISHK